jgi:pimeloyl-ACP methyl ester carboxylesterase
MGPQELRKLSFPGQKVDIGGFCLHAIVRGQGTPTVLLEPALGGFALQFAHIQEGISAFARVVAYDRAGQGWSDCSPNPRTPANLVKELRALLDRLDLQPPYVLLGHSFGGLLTRFFASLHPEEVAGVILVDSSDVEQYDSFPDVDRLVSQAATGVRLQKIAAQLGLGRVLGKISLGGTSKELDREDLEIFITVASHPQHQETMLAEFAQHRFYFGAGSEVPRTLGDTPLVILTAGKSVSGKGKFGGITIDQLNAKHQQWQRNLLSLSSQAEQITFPNATHLSILVKAEYTDQVVEAVRRMVAGYHAEKQ